MSYYPGMFEYVEEKLGAQPDGAPSTFVESVSPTLAPGPNIPATWFDPSFDPHAEVAIPFKVRFSDSIPQAEITEQPVPSPVYVPADAVAVYAPWHFCDRDFGAYIREGVLLELASRLARDLDVPFAEVAPHVLRQIVLHEQAHFMFEVGAAELEDIAQEWLYRPYLLYGAGPSPPLTDGVVEEIWASWREVEYARRMARKHLSLTRYPDLVAEELRQLPPGYCDFEVMRRQGSAVRAAVASLMRSSDQVVTGRWGAPTGKEADNMPLYWIGRQETLADLGGIPRTVSFPTIRRFARWLRMIGAQIDMGGGRGSHRKVRLPNGRIAAYATSAGRLHQAPANQIARELGIGNARTLFEHVRDMRPLE